MKELLSESHKYKLWVSNLKKNGLNIHEIDEIYTKYGHNGDALFALVMLDATTPEGDKIPPICFIKGEVVCVLVCLIDQESGEKFLLLVKQRRICNGDYIYESVAGMVDLNDPPLDSAIREVEEETGLTVTPDQVHALNTGPLFCATGTSDEALYFFYCELELSREKIFSYHNLQKGLLSEHERIFTHVATVPEAKNLITNTNGLLNIFLYEEATR